MKKVSKPGKSTASATATGKPKVGTTTMGQPSVAQKNSKETLQKKLALCQKTFDYKDESRDVKGKTERLHAISEIQTLLQD